MSEIAGELARVKGAFAQPTLTLLHQRQAPVVITIFRTALSTGGRVRSFARPPVASFGGVRTATAVAYGDRLQARMSRTTRPWTSVSR